VKLADALVAPMAAALIGGGLAAGYMGDQHGPAAKALNAGFGGTAGIAASLTPLLIRRRLGD
jgi:hypothetical protein